MARRSADADDDDDEEADAHMGASSTAGHAAPDLETQ
jgi:hypothetical protein